MQLLLFRNVCRLVLITLCAAELPLEVEISSGKIRGVIVDGADGTTVDAFLGVPYGAATGGQNRFSPPQTVDPWDGIFDASKFSQPCHQIYSPQFKDAWFISSDEESEDCLKVNIWAPKPRGLNRAVMVWIHGGGFAGGSSNLPYYNGAVLASHEDVIVVSLNYRLSVFGFLYLDHPLAPGNVGLLDQTLGLQWVKKNIKAFGGDPNRVTVFGHSAGAASTMFHLLYPNSLDLFQNVILFSGALNCAWAFTDPEFALKQSLLLLERAGCPLQENKRTEAIQCLQNLEDKKIVELATQIQGDVFRMIFRPVVDGKILSAPPNDLLSKRKFCSKKRILLGYTKEDGSFLIPFWAAHLFKKEKSQYNDEDLTKIISKLTYIEDNISDFPLDLISHFYLDWDSTKSNYSLSFEGIINFLTDRWFGCPATKAANEFTDHGNSVYFFRFDHEHNIRPGSTPAPSWFGVAHGDELPFVFGHTLQSDSDDANLSKQFMRYLANFAKTGDPNDMTVPTWPKYSSTNRVWLRIEAKKTTVDTIQRQKQCAFWENIYPKVEMKFLNEI